MHNQTLDIEYIEGDLAPNYRIISLNDNYLNWSNSGQTSEKCNMQCQNRYYTNHNSTFSFLTRYYTNHFRLFDVLIMYYTNHKHTITNYPSEGRDNYIQGLKGIDNNKQGENGDIALSSAPHSFNFLVIEIEELLMIIIKS